MPPSISLTRESLHLDYFIDYKDRICQVLTWHHPKDRRISIVKYDLGESYWTARETGIRYRRMLKSYSLEGHQDNLLYFARLEPDYSFHSEMYGVDFLAVPLNKIKKYYYPEKRLQEILSGEEKLDEIEQKVKHLAELFFEHLEIPYVNMGITGSIVWKGQTEKSDIDFIIYGNKYAQDFNERFPVIYEKTKRITPMSDNKRKRYEVSMAKKSGLPLEIVSRYIEKKKWLSVYGKTNVSLIFSPLPEEKPFTYSSQIFKPIKMIDVKCIITDTSMGFAYPAMYNIENCEELQPTSQKKSGLKRILSFEGALTGYFKKGDTVVVRGLLERVKDKKTGKIFEQIILGTKEGVSNEFILFEEDYSKIY